MTDAELLLAWRDGDQAAGAQLFEHHYASIARFFRNKVREPSDLIQQTFLACVESADRFRGDASFRSFLFAVATNVLRKYYRERSGPRGKVDLGSVSVEELGQSPSKALAARDEQRLLLAALRRLPVEMQMMLELHYWERMKVAELAEVLGIPSGTLKTRMRRARQMLEQMLGELAVAPATLHSTMTRLDDWAEGLRQQMAQSP